MDRRATRLGQRSMVILFESYCLGIQTHRHTTADFTWRLKWWRTDACRRMVSRDAQTIVHEILGTSVDLPNPNHAKLRHPTTKSRDICCRKLVLPKKWTKMYQNRRKPATHNVRHYANFIVLGQTIYEKRVTKFFIPLNILGPPEP